jgi:hypothetical protein
MPLKERQIVEVKLESCIDYCERSCYPKDRHYPYIGSLTVIGEPKYAEIKFIRINIMLGPENRIYGLTNLPFATIPKNYKFHTSVHYGAEDWNRYWWSTGRVPQLVPGDIFQEKYFIKPKTNLTIAQLMRKTAQSANYFKIRHLYRNFLVLDDSQNRLTLCYIKNIPDDPKALLRKVTISV